MLIKRTLATLLALASVNSIALEGKVVNSVGEPISGAEVKPMTSKEGVITSTEGLFTVPDSAEELHITAPGYSHSIVHVHDHKDKPLVVRLSSTVIEQVDVVGLPIHASVIESSMPVTVLSGSALRNQQAATLGDSLERQPGVNSNFHGNVASTPVIRGLSGPRVLITQNGLDVGDQSRVGPDHAVSSEVSTAQQIEILRGPATLFYGSGAIGGVVNVVDKRVPQETELRAEGLFSHDTVNGQNLVTFNANGGKENLAFYADGFWRNSDDYEVPLVIGFGGGEHDHEYDEEHDGGHEQEHGAETVVNNSAEESNGLTLGTSYLLDNGFVGVAVEKLDREYGIPGHSHGGDEQADEGRVYADLDQKRLQLQSELLFDSNWVRAINTRAAYTDYTHAEIEENNIGTVFSNKTAELRLDLFHQEWKHWKGGLNFHYKRSKAFAEGEEAFTPPSTSETLAMAFMEEKHIGQVLLQLGARFERVNISASSVTLPQIEVHVHDHAEGDELHDDHDGDSHDVDSTQVFAVGHDFSPVSVSFGAVWDFKPGYNLGFALSRAQRAPSASELFSFGPHIGTGLLEVGALFDLHKEGEEIHFERTEREIELETSNNIDLTFRKHEGALGFIINAFFNQVENYYYQNNTGYFAESAHAHDDHDEAVDQAHEDELPVYLFTFNNAEFYGLEAQIIWKLNDFWKATFFSDFVHAELDDGRYLPRTPPMRLGADIDFIHNRVTANLSWVHYTNQEKVASLESSTSGYSLLDLSLGYQLPLRSGDLKLFAKIENLTNADARVHTSFIKDVAPRPGRNFNFGIRGSF